jgi:hypothetical protein
MSTDPPVPPEKGGEKQGFVSFHAYMVELRIRPGQLYLQKNKT